MKIIVDGANGLLAYDIAEYLAENNEVVAIRGHQDLDLNDFNALREKIETEKPDFYIHVAGMKDVDDAQRDPIGAYVINTIVPANIALITGQMGIPMVHISSGAVFDGELGRPYTENEEYNPVNTYGKTKLKAEELVRYFNEKSFIIRVPLLFSAHGGVKRNPILKMYEKLKNGETGLKYTTDQLSNPSYALDIAKGLELLLHSDKYGTYNLGNRGEVSRYDYFRHIAQKLGFSGDELEPCLMGVKFAPREKSVVLDVSLFEKTFGTQMRPWQEAMEDCIRQIKEAEDA